MYRPVLSALLIAAALPVLAAPADPAALDALTVYTPTATYSWIGETLGFDAAAGSYGRAGLHQFGDGGIAPIVDGPRIFIDPWSVAGGWTLELQPSGATVSGCRLFDIDYKLASGAHVYLRCTAGPPQ